MEGEQEVVCNLSNAAISNDLEQCDPVFKVTPQFDVKYLTNGYRYGHIKSK